MAQDAASLGDAGSEHPSAVGPRGAVVALDPREQRTREVLAGDRLSMAFQPIVDLRSGELVGAEALARFRSEPYRTPDLWFNDAWASGLGIELEIHAIRQALASLLAMPEHVYLSVNAAPRTLLSRDLQDLLAGVSGDRLMVELTEHELVADYDEMSAAISRLRARGTRLAIDDAGAGFSSFQHILRLRPDVIKLDRSLTTGVDANPVRFALASALVTFAGSLGARICAEGVETSSELVALQKLGVAFGQGYFLGRPAALPLQAPPEGNWFKSASKGTTGKTPSTNPERLSQAPAARTEASPAMRSPARLAAVVATGLMDSDAEEAFDALARLAARLLGTPVALVSLLDAERQFFKSAVGMGEPGVAMRSTPLSHSLCQHAVTSKSPLIVNDARAHPLVRDNPAITDLGVIAYAGVPLITSEDHALGTLCVIDSSPREWSDQDVSTLSELAKLVVARIEIGNTVRSLEDYRALSEAIFEQMAGALMLCDIAGHIVRVNGPICELLGYSPKELLHRHIGTIKHPEDAPRDFAFRDRLLAGACQQARLQTRYLHRGGAWLDTHLTASVVRDSRGAARFTLLSMEAVG